MKKERDGIVDVAQETRAAIARAAAVPRELRTMEYRVLLAIIDELTTWSWKKKRVSITALARIVYGCELEDVTGWQRSKVSIALKRLAKNEIIGYLPQRGPGAMGTIALSKGLLDPEASTPGNNPPDSEASTVKDHPDPARETTQIRSERPPNGVATTSSSPSNRRGELRKTHTRASALKAELVRATKQWCDPGLIHRNLVDRGVFEIDYEKQADDIATAVIHIAGKDTADRAALALAKLLDEWPDSSGEAWTPSEAWNHSPLDELLPTHSDLSDEDAALLDCSGYDEDAWIVCSRMPGKLTTAKAIEAREQHRLTLNLAYEINPDSGLSIYNGIVTKWLRRDDDVALLTFAEHLRRDRVPGCAA